MDSVSAFNEAIKAFDKATHYYQTPDEKHFSYVGLAHLAYGLATLASDVQRVESRLSKLEERSL